MSGEQTSPRTGRKPEEEGGWGLQPEAEEVSGHWFDLYYTCWSCKARNKVGKRWAFFLCWKDGELNRLPPQE
jgi:hypothetical protein